MKTIEPLARLSHERSGRSPTLQKTENTSRYWQWRDDLRVVRGSFARGSIKWRFIPMTVATALALTQIPAANGGVDRQGGGTVTNLQTLLTAALNPVSHLIKVPFQNNFDFGIGPDRVTRYTLNFEPIVPFTLNEDWNLIVRTIVPFVSQPSAGAGKPSMTGLGDINPALFLSPSTSRRHFWGIGPTFTFPTGTSPQLTSGQWSMGPSAVYMATPGRWMIGGVVSHQWSVDGWSDRTVNSSCIQPMVICHLPKGWYLVSVPVITADWEADSGDRWTVPLGGGVGNIVKLGKMPLNLTLPDPVL